VSNDHGLTVYNDNGGLMFDSRRKMNSYVVTEVSTGTGPDVSEQTGLFPITDADFIFVKIPTNLQDSVIYYNAFQNKFCSRTVTINYSSGVPSTATFGSETEATLDYFVVKHSSKVETDDDFGLVILNEDGTKQFDSRSIRLGNHFKVTSFNPPASVSTWSPQTGGSSLGDLSDYWEISKWTGSTIGPGSTYIQGIWGLGGGPYAINYFSLSMGGETPLGSHPSNTSSETWGSTIYGMILSAELTGTVG
jgi:hypothetical protein